MARITMEGERVPPGGPNYNKRILDPDLLRPRTKIRRYYYYSNTWRHVDYVVTRPPYLYMGDRCVDLQAEDGPVQPQRKYLSDMGIVPDKAKFNPVVYTILRNT